MHYQLSATQENQLLHLPETGMGYQVVEATRAGSYTREKFLILNAERVVEMNEYQDSNVHSVTLQNIYAFKASATFITLNILAVLNEKQFSSIVNESKNESERAAIDNPVEYPNGVEIFVRLSAFDDDKRVDKVNKCLRPGSFTTTIVDYLSCKSSGAKPIERYALPTNDIIQFAFHIRLKAINTLQRGTVQKTNGKRGGGKEVYFDKGTSANTFLKQTAY